MYAYFLSQIPPTEKYEYIIKLRNIGHYFRLISTEIIQNLFFKQSNSLLSTDDTPNDNFQMLWRRIIILEEDVSARKFPSKSSTMFLRARVLKHLVNLPAEEVGNRMIFFRATKRGLLSSEILENDEF